ncbi:MAG: MBL fold metallo-hydrolase [Acidobacteriota bacterium]|nr:MBL fold metallo-hydrolase [Acidobacteriota bacterium]
MKRWPRRLVLSCVLFVGCGGAATPELQLVEDAAEAMGSLRTVRETTGVLLEGQGRTYRLGQNMRPRADLPFYEVENYQLQVDFANQRWQVRQDRTTTFLTGSPLYGVRQTFGLDGDVAYDQAGDQAVQGSDQVAAERWAEMYHNPLGIVLLALDETSTVGNLREEDGQQLVDVVATNGTQFTLGIDASTGLPRSVTSVRYHPVLGDVAYETVFEDYGETGGLGGFQARLTLPRQYTTNLDEHTIAEYRVTSDNNAQLGNLSAPSPEPAMVSTSVEAEEITDGVWFLTGGSHHSVLVEFDEFLALVEAPQNEARTLAVIEHARQLQPEKPLQYVVNTHHHFDHSGGIRAAVSEGLTVITHQINRTFFEDLVARQHTLMPDALATNPQPLTIETVTADEVYELTSGSRTLQVARISGDRHGDGIVMAYLPRERILIEADAFSPTSNAAPFAAALLENIEERELRVELIVPIHGGVSTMEDLESAIRREEGLS